MEYKPTTATEAVLDFEKKIFYDLWPGERNQTNREYARCYKIIQAAKAGRLSEARARLMLEEFGGDRYRVSTSFEVATEK